MSAFAKRRTLHILVAIMALLFSTLAPSISPAFASSSSTRNSYLADICTSANYKVATLSIKDLKQAPASDGHAMEHCVCCAAHDGPDSFLTSASVPLAVIDGHDFHSTLFYTAPVMLDAWTAANPRAPPSRI
ncbi:DUF2946 domain-containing protein [Duganella sp. FT3S]|uniref:DUF2946 domain-containing protein n=1 Tax=Rugamonas fusca TaxID=2758568 RepID=A0A7W2EE87_9BURK|nr:DUF2946 domain-containing protein [Rugamonas fusca]MBA5604226.1 DUF2946 domain-containing protein [Rugamonas fusca]